MTCADDTYSGSDATSLGLCALADAYRVAAVATANVACPGVAHSIAPVRLLAIQTVELYLIAFSLLVRTAAPKRRMGQDLAVRAELATAGELALRRRTVST